MKITDEQLSAFLDNELPATEMEQVRSALATDETVAERLAQFAQVDEIASRRAELLTQSPLPPKVVALLEKRTSRQPNWLTKFLDFSWPTAAIAASLAVVVTLQFNNPDAASPDTPWQTIASVLETEPSGERYQQQSVGVLPRFSFVNQQGQYCRQYQVTQPQATTEAVACRDQSGVWQKVVEQATFSQVATSDFQTASGAQALDRILDTMMASAPLVGTDEKQLITTGWQVQQSEQTP